MKAKPLEDWNEEIGDVVWWAWDADKEEWLGEPAYIGTPLDLGQTVEVIFHSNLGEFVNSHLVGGWPGYHTHWTPHPNQPELPLEPIEYNDLDYLLERMVLLKDRVYYSRDGDTCWFSKDRDPNIPDWINKLYPIPKGQTEFIGDAIIEMRDLGWLTRRLQEFGDEEYHEYDEVSAKGKLDYLNNIVTKDWPAIDKLSRTLPGIVDNEDGEVRPSRLNALVKVQTYILTRQKQ